MIRKRKQHRITDPVKTGEPVVAAEQVAAAERGECESVGAGGNQKRGCPKSQWGSSEKFNIIGE